MKPPSLTPIDKLEPFSWMTAPATHAVIEALTSAGAEARFVGGCVRDSLLGRPVDFDIDIATHLNPDEVIKLLGAAQIRAIPTGIEHGTVTAVIGQERFEITTLRRDVETFGRQARVAFTAGWAEDAARRDFTMNALFLGPDGALYDPIGGIGDLKSGRVRFVGEPRQRIAEDMLRLLRYFRFFAHYEQGDPDPDALDACQELASGLASLSGERIGAEILRLLEAPDPAPTLELMAARGVLGHVLAEAQTRTKTFPRLRALAALEAKGASGLTVDAPRRLAAVIEADDKAASQVAARLRFSNADRDRLRALVAPSDHMVRAVSADDAGRMVAARRALYHLGREIFRDRVALAWAAAMADHELSSEETSRFEALMDAGTHWVAVMLPVTGQDVAAQGVEIGPQVGEHLKRLEAWWEAQDFAPDRGACLDQLKRQATGEGG